MSTERAGAAYDAFLRSRWPVRSFLLGKYALGGSLVFLLFDWILTRSLPVPPSFGTIAVVRLIWIVMPLLGMLLAHFAPQMKRLPAIIVIVSLLWCWGNQWAYFHLGLAGTTIQMLAVIASCVTAATFMPLRLAGIVGVFGSIAGGQVAMDIAWPQAQPLSLRLWADAGMLAFVVVEIAVFRNFSRNQRRGLALRADLERALADLDTSRRVREAELQHRVQQALKEVKILSGLLPICAACKKIRDDVGSWHQVENYVRNHTGAEFSHGLCPECAPRYFPPTRLADASD